MPQPAEGLAADLSDSVVQDAEDRRVVLAFLLGAHPAQLTIPEIAQTLYARIGDFKSEDAVERAIRDLVGMGVLRCHSRFILLALAAPSCPEPK